MNIDNYTEAQFAAFYEFIKENCHVDHNKVLFYNDGETVSKEEIASMFEESDMFPQ